jgi:hypothetical protein
MLNHGFNHYLIKSIKQVLVLPLCDDVVIFWKSSVSTSPSCKTRSDWKRLTFSDKLVTGVDELSITSVTDLLATDLEFLQ